MRIAWRDEYIATVKKLWRTKDLEEIADHLDISESTLRRHIRRLGLILPYRRREWMIEEDEYITKNYRVKPVAVIAKTLKRSVSSVQHRASRIGIAFTQPRHLLNRDEVATMIGAPSGNLHKRYTDSKYPMPCIRSGRYVQFDEYEVIEWLKEGHILAFDRAKMAKHLHRVYDAWRSVSITSTEIYTECQPIGEAMRGEEHDMRVITIAPTNQFCYYKADVFAFAYRFGNRIPPWASERFQVIRQAWETEYVMKADVIADIGEAHFGRRIVPHLTTTAKFYAKRTDVCKALRRMGREDLVRKFTDVAIPWPEMMADYEKRSAR